MRRRERLGAGSGSRSAWGGRARYRRLARAGPGIEPGAVPPGCRLAICARDESELEAARAELEQSGAEVLAVPCDVADPTQVAAMVEAGHPAPYGRIDILINNAGTIIVAPVETLTRTDFERVMATISWGVLIPTLEVLPGDATRVRADQSTSLDRRQDLGPAPTASYSALNSPRSDFPRGCGRELADTESALRRSSPV